MKLRVMIAVLACKLCRALIRLLGRGGTDFPGRVALKLCPNLLGELAKNVTTVIVTGTNGKTTTSRMIEQSWHGRWNLLLCQQIRREPPVRRHGGIRRPLHAHRPLQIFACADRGGRGGAEVHQQVRRRKGDRSTRTSSATSLTATARSRIRSESCASARRTARTPFCV